MSHDDDSLDQLRQSPTGWSLEQELDIAAEVYGPEPRGHRAAADESEEETVERFRRLLGFDLRWEEPD